MSLEYRLKFRIEVIDYKVRSMLGVEKGWMRMKFFYSSE